MLKITVLCHKNNFCTSSNFCTSFFLMVHDPVQFARKSCPTKKYATYMPVKFSDDFHIAVK